MTERAAPPAPPTARSLALALFDATATAHGLRQPLRRLLGLAAACYDAARATTAESPERVARDMILSVRIADLTADEQALAAAAVAMLRPRARPRREPTFLRLDEQRQTAALRLGALLRVAASLAEGRALGVQVESNGAALLLLVGPADAQAVTLADARADLWRDRIGALELRPAGDLPPLAEAPEEPWVQGLALRDGMQGDEPLAEAARRTLRRMFERLLARGDAVGRDEDPEDVHEMRVATRRLRASLQVVEGVFDVALMERMRRGLRRTARALGAVRDYDVFLDAVLGFQASLPDERRQVMEPLVTAVREARGPARVRLVEELESRRFARFARAFADFLTTPGAGVAEQTETGAPSRVRDFAGSAIWRRYEQWRAFDAVLPGSADEVRHQARIAGKRLRYTIELFEDALGPRADQVLEPLAALQECLGALQDAVIAREHVRALGMDGDAGAQSFLAGLDAEHDRQLLRFPQLWERVDSATYRRRLFELMIRV